MKRFVAIVAAGTAIAVLSAAQSTTINGGRIIRGVWDASNAATTKPARTGTELPANCETGEAFFKTDAEPGRNLYLCTAAGAWSEISGGIVSGAGQLSDFAVTRTSATVLTVPSTGAVRFGNHTCPAPGAPATLTIASGSGTSGTARLYVTPGCTLTWGLDVTDSTNVTCDENCAAVDGVAAFPSDAVPLFEWNASAGQWNPAGTDLRAFISAKVSRAAAQGGIIITGQADGADEFSVDASIVSTFSSGTAAPPATCGVGQKYNKIDTNQSYECTSTSTWTETTGGGASHLQNTDTGTTATSFQVDSDSSGPKMKNNTGTLEVRNAADDAYAPMKASSFEATGTGDWTPGEAGTSNLGSATLPFADIYMSGTSGTPAANNFKITGASTSGTRTVTLPDGDATVPTNTLLTAVKIRTCEIHIWGTGASSTLQDTDDEAVSCFNAYGATLTISEVRCWANAGSPTVLPIVTGGAANSILSGALTCGTGAWVAGMLNGTPTLTNASTIDANIETAGGVATNIRLVIKMTL